jgi:hypothetical protein
VDSAIGVELKGKSGSSYRLDRFLGGGQTASVYRATVVASGHPERRGVAVAVKMMLPGLDTETQRRFWQEETVLVRLWSGLEKSPATQPLLPEVWDSGDSIGGGFLVMTLAQGRPLDELLREGILWDELDALRLIHQLSKVFRSLHSNLQRSYLDFRPHNIFWDGPSRSICVINWNLLSRAYQSGEGTISELLAAEGRRAYRQDLQTVARLFYRLLLGQEVGGLSLLDLAAPARWKELTQSMRLLLWELLQPASEYLESATAFHDRMEAEVNRRALSGDGLLKQADEIVEKIKGLDEEATKRGDGIGLRQEAAALLELAESKGLSPTWARFLQNLYEALRENAETASYVTSGQAFLRAGDRGLAQQFFADGIRLAAAPEEQMQGWRWWQLAGASLATQSYARIEAILLTTPTTIADESVAAEVTSLLGETSGQAGFDVKIAGVGRTGSPTAFSSLSVPPGMSPVLKEIRAQYRIARLLGVETVRLDSAALEEWVKAGETAVRDLDGLSGTLEGIHYSQSAWRVQRQGKEFVQAKLTELRGRRQFLDRLQEGLAAVKSAQDALLLLEEHPEFRAEESLAAELVQKIPDWLDEKESLLRITQLLRELELQKQPDERRETLNRLRGKVYRLQVAQEWIERLLTPSDRVQPDPPDPIAQLLKGDRQKDIGETVEVTVAGVERAGPSQSPIALEGNENITAESLQGKVESPQAASDEPIESEKIITALNETTLLLKMAHQEVPEAPKLLEAMAEQLVEASVRLRCSTPLLEEWFVEVYPEKSTRLITNRKLIEEIETLRGKLTDAQKAHDEQAQQLNTKLEETQTSLNQLSQEYEKKKAAEEAALTAEIEKLKNSQQSEIEKLTKSQQSKIEKLTNSHQAEIDRMEARRRKVQQELDTVGEDYEKEKRLQEEQADGWRKQADEARAALNDTRQEVSKIQEKFGSGKSQADQEQRRLEQTQAANRKAKQELDEYTASIQKRKTEKRSVELQLSQLQQELAKTRERVHEIVPPKLSHSEIPTNKSTVIPRSNVSLEVTPRVLDPLGYSASES